MPEVFSTLTKPGGAPKANEVVRIRLIASANGEAEGFVAATDTTILDEYATLTDSTGRWAVTLDANALITPANSVYQVIQPGIGGGKVTETFAVPNAVGPFWLGDILAEAPVGLPQYGLDVHANDVAAHAGELAPASHLTDAAAHTGTLALAGRTVGVPHTIADAAVAEYQRRKMHGEGHLTSIPVNSYSSTVGFVGQNASNAGAAMVSALQNDEITYTVPMVMGFHHLRIMHGVGTNRGVYTVRVNGVQVSTFDGYSASGSGSAVTIIGPFLVRDDGPVTLNFKMATKNGASTAYIGVLVDLACVAFTVRALTSLTTNGTPVIDNVGGLVVTNDAEWKRSQVREIGNVVHDPTEADVNRRWKFTYSGVNALNSVALGIAFSPDGNMWTDHPLNPIVPLGEDPYIAINIDSTAYRDAQNRLHMFSEEKTLNSINSQNGINHHTSTDGVTWTPDPANPVIAPAGGTTAWDATDRTSPVVVWDGTQFVMLFEGRKFGGSITPGTENNGAIGVARSPNGTTWTLDAANPIISPSTLGGTGWDEGSVVPDDIRRISGTWCLIAHGGFTSTYHMGRYLTTVAPAAWTVGSFAQGDYNPYSIESNTDMFHGSDGSRVVRRPGIRISSGVSQTPSVQTGSVYAV